MQSHETVFSATGIGFSVGMESERVDGTEMALDAGELFFENQMVEAGIELANLGRGGGYLPGLLTTSKHHLETVRISS